MSENKKPYRTTSRKNNSKQGTKEAIVASDSWIYHKVTVSSRKRCNIGSMW